MDEGEFADRDEHGFQHHEQYKIIHGRSHRKSPPRVGTPALTRHLAFWIPSTPETDAANLQSERDGWIATIDWFLASLILNAYEGWQSRINDVVTSRQMSRSHYLRWATLKSLIPMSFNADDPRENENEPPRYLFQFFRHTALYRANSVLDRGSVRFLPNETVKQEAEDYYDISGQGIWDDELPPVRKEGDGEDADFDLDLAKVGDRFETVSFRLFLGAIPIKVRAELHTEYFTLSFTAELDGDMKIARRLGRDDNVEAITKHFDTLSGIVERRFKERHQSRSRRQEAARARKDIEEAMTPCALLVEDFWRKIDREFVHPAFSPTIPHPLSGQSTRREQGFIRDKLGKYITDCRGLVLTVDREGDSAWTLMKPFDPPRRTSARDYVGLDKRFITEDAIDIFGAIEPIVDAARQASSNEVIRAAADSRPDKRVFEYTLSSVQRGRALYVSALAPQPPWSEYHDPLCYMVLTRHRHRWQIGRFLDRMNMLGTLRVASLMNYPNLNLAGFKLRDLERRLNKLGLNPSDANSKRVDSEDMHKEHAEILRCVPDGGLLYRTDRSLFYMRNFLAECEAMKFERVEGFQAYPSFVQRRLGQTWDYIGVLKQRAVQISKRLSALSNDVRAEQEYKQTVKLERLSDFAEKAATIPIAYYGGHALEYLLHWRVGDVVWQILKYASPIGWMMPTEPTHYHPYLAIYMALAGAIYFYVMHSVKKRREREDKP